MSRQPQPAAELQERCLCSAGWADAGRPCLVLTAARFCNSEHVCCISVALGGCCSIGNAKWITDKQMTVKVQTQDPVVLSQCHVLREESAISACAEWLKLWSSRSKPRLVLHAHTAEHSHLG